MLLGERIRTEAREQLKNGSINRKERLRVIRKRLPDIKIIGKGGEQVVIQNLDDSEELISYLFMPVSVYELANQLTIYHLHKLINLIYPNSAPDFKYVDTRELKTVKKMVHGKIASDGYKKWITKREELLCATDNNFPETDLYGGNYFQESNGDIVYIDRVSFGMRINSIDSKKIITLCKKRKLSRQSTAEVIRHLQRLKELEVTEAILVAIHQYQNDSKNPDFNKAIKNSGPARTYLSQFEPAIQKRIVRQAKSLYDVYLKYHHLR